MKSKGGMEDRSLRGEVNSDCLRLPPSVAMLSFRYLACFWRRRSILETLCLSLSCLEKEPIRSQPKKALEQGYVSRYRTGSGRIAGDNQHDPPRRGRSEHERIPR